MALSIVFILLSFVFFAAAVLALLFPVKFASFLPKRLCPDAKRFNVFARYLIVSLVSFGLFIVVLPKNETKQSSEVQIIAEESQKTEAKTETQLADSTSDYTPQHTAQTAEESQKKEQEAARLKKEFIALYGELMDFRYDSQFHQIGFSSSGKYHAWQQKVFQANETYSKEAQLQTGLIFGQLAQLGLAYQQNQGRETDIVNFFLPDMKKAMGR